MIIAGKVRTYRCTLCPDHLTFEGAAAKKQQGVMMYPGEQYCVAAQRARVFRRSDPKTKVPAWCPKQKAPFDIRVYGFKNTEAWLLHEQMCHALGKELSPEGYRYALVHQGTTLLSGEDFLARGKTALEETLGINVPLHHVVEIDNGLHPVFLYKTLEGYRIEPNFNAKRARQNQSEER